MNEVSAHDIGQMPDKPLLPYEWTHLEGGAACTHMNALSCTPCLSASSLDLPMVLVLIRLAHLFLQSGAPLADT